MGFSIGSLISGVSSVASLVGAGQSLAGAAGGSSFGPRRNPLDFQGPGPGGHFHTDPRTVPHAHAGGAFGSFIVSRGGAFGSAAPAFPQTAQFGTRAILPLIRSAAGAFGRRFSAAQKRRALLLARELGITAAATALGITILEMADLLASSRRRRSRGITASQIKVTKATIRRVESVSRAIAKACPPPARRRALARK